MYDYYVEGFELFLKYLAKHHPGLDFSNLDMEIVENEVLANHQSEEGVGEGGDVAAVDEAISVDLSSSALPKIISVFFFFLGVRQKLCSFGPVVLSAFILFFF